MSTLLTSLLVLAMQDGTPEELQKKQLQTCAENLRRLHKLHAELAAKKKRWAGDLGVRFWDALKSDPAGAELPACPAAKKKPAPYRGPSRDVEKLQDEDPIGACEPGRHAGDAIVVLRKSGDTLVLRPGEVGYKDALKLTRGPDEELIKDCRNLIDNLTQAAKQYELDWNAYPPSGNTGLVEKLKSAGAKKIPYFEFRAGMLNDKHEVLDPWGHPLAYRNNASNYPANLEDKTAHNKTSFDLYSFGPDGQDDGGSGDDITNWD
jgi:hypothetical protein